MSEGLTEAGERRSAGFATDVAVDDWSLLARASDRDALAELFDRHREYVFRVAWSVIRDLTLAEDVVQEVFVRMHRGHRRWRPRAAFRTWLYRVVANTARELARRQLRDQASPNGSAASDRTGNAAAVVVVSPRDPVLGDLAPALDALPVRQREAVILRHLEGMSTAETARAMRVSAGSVKTHLHRALAALRETFAGDDRRRP